MISRPIAIALVVTGAIVVAGGAVLVAGQMAKPTAEQMYRACIDGLWPDEDDAKRLGQRVQRVERREAVDEVPEAIEIVGEVEAVLGAEAGSAMLEAGSMAQALSNSTSASAVFPAVRSLIPFSTCAWPA